MVIELVGDPTIWFNEPLFKKEQFTRRLLPGLQLCVASKVWTAIVPDEPYRAKGLC